jgi:Winged helix DNA-binding domain
LSGGRVRHVSIAERRHRMAIRHHLAAPGPGIEQIAEDLVGYHASDPVSVFLEARARFPDLTVAAMEDALYERRSLLKLLGMRRTMFVVPPELGSVVDAACTRLVSAREHRRFEQVLDANGVTDDPKAWIATTSELILDELRSNGPATAKELGDRIPGLGLKVTMGAGRWAVEVAVSTRMLFLLAADTAVIRTRPLGTWMSSLYRYAATDLWSPELLRPRDTAEAQADLVERWLRRYGPGTMTDLRWWTGLTKKAITDALGTIGAVEVTLEGGGPGWLAPGDAEAVEPPAGEWVALLPGLDATVMGWKERDWYLDPGMVPKLFDTAGNAGNTVLVSGRIVGAWGQRPDGSVAVGLIDPIDASARRLIDAEASRLTDWLDGTVVAARFPTPLVKQLNATSS